MGKPAYRRVLIKLSGESLLGSNSYGVDPEACAKIARSIQEISRLNVQVAIVIGGGNIFRGIQSDQAKLDRIPADQIGMLATLINGISLQGAFEKLSIESKVLSAFSCPSIVETYSWSVARKSLEMGNTLILVGGTGNPFFTTDSAAALRALEIGAEAVLKGTKVDGIYNKDPIRYPDAVKFERLSYSEVLSKNLKVMDAAAIALCRENGIPIRVFNLFSEGALMKAVMNQSVGTLVEGL